MEQMLSHQSLFTGNCSNWNDWKLYTAFSWWRKRRERGKVIETLVNQVDSIMVYILGHPQDQASVSDLRKCSVTLAPNSHMKNSHRTKRPEKKILVTLNCLGIKIVTLNASGEKLSH